MNMTILNRLGLLLVIVGIELLFSSTDLGGIATIFAMATSLIGGGMFLWREDNSR